MTQTLVFIIPGSLFFLGVIAGVLRMTSTLLYLSGKLHTRQTVVLYATGRCMSNEGSCDDSMLKIWFACKDVTGAEVRC